MTTFFKALNTLILSALLFTFSNTAFAGNTVEMEVDGLVCAFCAQGITKNLKKLPATEDVFVSLENRLVAMSVKEGAEVSDDKLTDVLTGAGYTVRSITRTDRSIAEVEKAAKSK